MVTTTSGLILAIGKSAQGSMHDITMFCEDNIKLGPLTASMKNKKTKKKDKVTIYADLGYLGIKDDLPGANVMQPIKKSKNKKLTLQQKMHTKKVNRARVRIEHTIGKIKQYRIMSQPYIGTDEEFHNEFVVLTGLVNFDLLWDEKHERLKLDF